MNIVGLIPARGGSRAIPGKNLRRLAGKPLLQWTIDCARKAEGLDRVILSTDDDEIAEFGRSLDVEVPFRRPGSISQDDSPMIDVVIHALNELRAESYAPDAIALLQPTSPLRRPEHIAAAIEALEGADSVCSVVPVPKTLCPHYLMRLDEAGYLRYFLPDGAHYTRRQDVPQAYSREGTIYLVRREVVLKEKSLYGRRCVPLLVDPADSLSIDEPSDWAEAERRVAARKAQDS